MPPVKLKKKYPRNVSLDDSTFRLRRIAPDDKKAILKFARELPEENHLFLRMDITKPEVVDEWVDSNEAGRRVTILAENDGKLVGYGSLNRQDLSWTRHMGEIRVIVDAKERSKGLGTLLAKEIFDIAQELGLSKIVAQMVREQEGARRMFERLGFNAEALLTDWVIDRSGKTRDLVVMSHDVTALTS